MEDWGMVLLYKWVLFFTSGCFFLQVGAVLQVALFRDSVVFTDWVCELVSGIYSVL